MRANCAALSGRVDRGPRGALACSGGPLDSTALSSGHCCGARARIYMHALSSWFRGDRADADDATIVRVGPLSAETLAMILQSPDENHFKYYGFFSNRAIRLAFERHQARFVYRRRVMILVANLGVSLSTMWWRGAINGPLWYIVLLSICSAASLAFFAALPMMARRSRLLMRGEPRVGDVLLFAFVMLYLMALPGMYLTGADVLETSGDGIDLPDRATHSLRISAFCLVAATGGVFFSPVLALLTGGITGWAYCHRYNRLLGVAATVGGVEVGVGVPMPPLSLQDFLLHAGVATVLVLVHERNAIEQFRLECAVQRVAARRIDQLNNEKERIGFELAMEEVRLETFERRLATRGLSPMLSPSHDPRGGEGVHEEDETRSQMREQAYGDAVSLDASVPSIASPQASPKRAASVPPMGPARLLHGGAGRSAGGSHRSAGGSSLGGSCDEVVGIMEGAGVDASAPPPRRPNCKPSVPTHAETLSSRAISSLSQPAAALARDGEEQDVSMPRAAAGAKIACVRTEEGLSWPERQQLRGKRVLKVPALGRGYAASDSGSSAMSSGSKGGPLASTEQSHTDGKGLGWTCPKRERALWRTLRRAGCLGSAASSAGSAASSTGSDAGGALSNAHRQRQANLPCVV